MSDLVHSQHKILPQIDLGYTPKYADPYTIVFMHTVAGSSVLRGSYYDCTRYLQKMQTETFAVFLVWRKNKLVTTFRFFGFNHLLLMTRLKKRFVLWEIGVGIIASYRHIPKSFPNALKELHD